MGQHYSNPEDEPYSKTDIDIWHEPVAEVHCEKCGTSEIPECSFDKICPHCKTKTVAVMSVSRNDVWWYWYRYPGELPTSGIYGPYSTEEAALESARNWEIERHRGKGLTA